MIPHLWLEAHVKHPVCLIQDHICDSAEVGYPTYTLRKTGIRKSVKYEQCQGLTSILPSSHHMKLV